MPTSEPSEFVAGDTVRWTKSLADFAPADGWALHYRLTNAGAGAEIVTANIQCDPNNNGGWDVSIASTHSAVVGGVWQLIGWVTNGADERHVVFNDEITILADATSAPLANLLTDNERILAAIDARLEGRITADQEQVTIDSQSIMRIPIEQLSKLRGIYAAKVWREQNPGLSYPQHRMRFTRAR